MQIHHPGFGLVEVTPNVRARRFTFRIGDEGQLRVTTPMRFSEKELLRAIDSLAPKLQSMKERKGPAKLITPDFVIDQPDFRMQLREGMVDHVRARISDGTLEVVYPRGTNFEQAELQNWLRKVSEEALRHQAKLVLPRRLHDLAQQVNLQFASVSIHNSRGRWGSCSSRKSINLSLYLILLPRHLQDYVMLHELTHLLHMDHSPQFWAQLDAFCGCSSKALREELRQYDTSIFFRKA